MALAKESVVAAKEKQAKAAKRKGQFDYHAKALVDGKLIGELIPESPGFVLQNLRRLEAFEQFLQAEKLREMQRPNYFYCSTNAPSSHPLHRICSWIENHLLRPHSSLRLRHLYICGPPLIGKTMLVQQLVDHGIRVYRQPNEEFFDLYRDGDYDMCLLDDFEGRLSIHSTLAPFLDGYSVNLKRKGMCPVTKKQVLPCIFTSNFVPGQLPGYARVSPTSLGAFESRVDVINFFDTSFANAHRDMHHSIFLY